MSASGALESVAEVESFMLDYYAAWQGTDEDRIVSYCADNGTVQIPGALMQGQAAIRERLSTPSSPPSPGVATS